MARTDKTDPLAILVVNNMLLTGFDAPVEQVLYLDRKIVAPDLLQAIARVNRTCGRKKCGYVVDYLGVARHLTEALKDYDGADTEAGYVIVHELVHLQEPHHGPEFWQSLGRALPHWRQRKEELQSRAREFLSFDLGTQA